MGPFYLALCRDFHRDVDQALADEFKKANTTKVQVGIHVRPRTYVFICELVSCNII